jgi:type II secretory pathway pseudopilin PulG
MSPRNRHASRARRAGVGLVELMIALAIAAGLLTATAVALNASTQAYRANQELSSLGQRSRLAMHRMLLTIRAAEDHLPDSPGATADFHSGLVVTDAGIAMTAPGGGGGGGGVLVYKHDPANQRLLVEVNGVTRPLLEGVSQFQVRLEPMRSAEHIRTGLNYDRLRRATILMTVNSNEAQERRIESTGQASITLSSSVAPRRNTW